MSTFRRPPPPTTTASRRRVPTPTLNNPRPPFRTATSSRTTSLQSSGSSTSSAVTNKGDGNIQVVVRCRGVSPSEIKKESKLVATVPSSRGTTVILTDPSPSLPSSSSSSTLPPLSSLSSSSASSTTTTTPTTRSWDFGTRHLTSTGESKGNVYGPDAKQSILYDEVAKPILEQVLEGYNCTIFAYGQTGTGKTYTMEGDLSPNGATFHDEAGIIPRTLYYLFDHLSKSTDQGEYTVKCSYVELYNEELRDLNAREDSETLSPPPGGLKIYDELPHGTKSSTSSASSSRDSNGGNGTSSVSGGSGGGSVRIEGLEETFITDAEEGLEVLRRGSMRRISASTNMNERSSRSHSIFTILVHLKDSPSSPTSSTSTNATSSSLLKVGKLNLVDLAGSENVGRSGAVQGRAREAGRINVSLLALGRVINMLSSNNTNGGAGLDGGTEGGGGGQGGMGKKAHIPYRESKLTRLLQDSLGGNTKTTIIATISPTSYEETASTLSYALQATSIQNRPEANRKIGRDVVLNQVMGEMARVKMDLKAARNSEGYYMSRESYEELELERQHYRSSLVLHSSTLAELEISKSELQSTRDQLEQNVRALAKTKDQLKKTSEELDRKEERLEEVERELEGVRVENESLKCLTDAWEVSRKGWKEEAEEALGDVQGLRDKLARKSLVERSNLSIIDDASSSIASRTSEITTQTTKLRQAQSDFVWSIEARLAEFSKRQQSRFGDNKDLIETFVEEVSKGIEKVVDGEERQRWNGEVFRRILEETCQSLFEKIRRRSNETEGEQDVLTNRIREELGRHASDTSALLDALVRPIQSLHADCIDRLKQDRSLLLTTTQEETEALSTENAFLKQLVSTLESSFAAEQARQAAEEASILARVQVELATAARRRQEAMQETHDLVRGGMTGTKERSELATKRRIEVVRTLERGNELLTKRLDEAINEAENVKGAGIETVAASLDQIQQLQSLQHSSSAHARAEQTDLLQRAASFVKESSIAWNGVDLQTRRESRRTLRALVEQTGDVFAAWSLANNETHDDVQAVTDSTVRTVTDYANLASRAISGVNICNNGLASKVQADLQRRVRHDVSTGLTPKPKERPPTDRLLPLVDLDSADRPTVLETLLKARDAELAASLAAEEERRHALDSMRIPMNEEDEGMSRSPSLEVVALPAIGGRPRASSIVVPQGGKPEMRRSRVGVLGERDSNVVAGGQRKPLGKRVVKKSVV